MLTGLPQELLPLLKTKDNADLAGPFLLQDVWKVSQKSLEVVYNHSLNNNLLIVQLHMEIKDAMVDLWITLLNMLLLTELLPKLNILIQVFKEHAKLTLDHSKFLAIKMLLKTIAVL